MEVAFKLATISDLDTLAKFVQEFYQSDHFLPFDQSAVRATLERILEDDSLGRVWLIQLEEANSGKDCAIGYVVLTLGYSLEYRGRDAFVDELYIQEHERGRGIGTKTLEFVEAACRSLGIRALHLEVERTNTRAQSLYQKAGFAAHDRYLMSKWISEE